MPLPSTELTASWSALGLAALSAAAVLVIVIGYTRIAGLRSFSKMSSFDFANTVAIGSTMATVALSGSSLATGAVVLATFYLVQVLIALARRHGSLGQVVDNQPILLVAEGRFLEANLDRARVTVSDVHAKLREANVFRYEDARAVILETTGDISVIHGDGPLDLAIFDDVRDAEELQTAGRGT